jgi:hypothetical protein
MIAVPPRSLLVNPNKPSMKNRQNRSPRASALQTTFISLSVLLLTLTWVPGQDQPDATWTATGSMGTARYDHTATLLPSGKVLVAGGLTRGGGLSSAELYDQGRGFDSN